MAGVGLARATAAVIGDGLSFAAELSRSTETTAEEAQESAAVRQRSDMNRRIEAFAQRVREQLSAAGFELSQPLTLTGDGLGGISAGDHPHRAAIEELLEGDVLLLRDFERLKDEHESSAGPANDFQLTITQPASP
jgi:hypothetical protein